MYNIDILHTILHIILYNTILYYTIYYTLLYKKLLSFAKQPLHTNIAKFPK